ncbi:MAG TPA: RNA polymerase sigma factor SigJ [Pyrinomonadaceae bacterium]|nr:RNA polymerase sigma factor SigJ [Pyrinomonadaceae bacterium]
MSEQMFKGEEEKVEIYKKHRARLFGIAYRMLGTHAESEDILQEVYIKWHETDAERIENAEAWLVTIATRLSIDRLRKAAKTRETYIGPWLPEPFVVSEKLSPHEELELASNLSMAFMFLLERLSPVERAAFLLHDIFDCGYADIARIVGKTETASRQLIHRARERVRTDKTRFEADEKMREKLIKKFVAASVTGDEKTLFELFSDEIVSVSDGGGKVTAARKIIKDKAKLVHALGMFGKKYGESFKNILYTINGELGVLTFIEGNIYSATTFEFENGKISAIYRVMNPDKLKQITNQ